MEPQQQRQKSNLPETKEKLIATTTKSWQLDGFRSLTLLKMSARHKLNIKYEANVNATNQYFILIDVCRGKIGTG